VVESLVVLAERALSPADAQRLVALHHPDHPSVRVLVAAGGRRNMLVDVLDHLSLLELRGALGAVQGHVERTPEQAEADVRAGVAALRDLGCEASGEVVTQDPVEALDAEVRAGAEEVVIVTVPHAVEDTLHRDWASVARDRLGVPVLHVYADSSWVG
jgi:hypothetical protein